MWTLRHPSGQLIHLLPDTTTTIGRKSCDLILEDSSVSHLHAKILITTNNHNDFINNEYSSKCIISNAGSKKRTKIISDKTIYLLPFTNYELKHNDKIHFSSKNEWTVSYKKISLLTCGDCIDRISNLHKIITIIGGTVFTEWHEDCNFYSTICKRVTPKFVTALAAGLPFVTLKYWEDFYACCKTRKEFPNPSQYILNEWHYTDELKDISLQPEIARQSLFNNIEFIFFSKYQIDYYGEIIQLAGGRPLMCGKYGFKDKHLLAQNTIIIACEENQRTSNSCCGLSESDYQNVYRLLVKEKRKMIDETEIVKAILLCSREKYCITGFPKLNESKQSKRSIKNQQTVTIKPEDIVKQKIPHKSRQNTEKSPEKYASESSTTDKSKKKNKINQKQFSTSTPAIARFPEAIVKLQKLTPNVISQFKYSNNKSDVNEKSTKRKRKSNSPIVSVSGDSSSDMFQIYDDYLEISDSQREPTPKKQLEIVNDRFISEKIILKMKKKTKKLKMESKASSPSPMSDNEITKNLVANFEPDFQYNWEEVNSQFDKHLSVTSISDKEDNTTINNNKEVSQISEELPQFTKNIKAQKPIPKKIVSKLWRDYDPRIEEPHLVNDSNVRKVNPSTKFRSLFDEYIPKRKSEKDYPIDEEEEDPKIQMIQSFIDEENRRQTTQSNITNTKSSFFMKSANEKNTLPPFIQIRRQ